MIGRLETTALEARFFTIAARLRVDQDVGAAIASLREFAPGDDAFVIAFRTTAVPERSVARYILRELEHARRTTEELNVALPPRVHVEHIYPHTPRAGEKWENHSAYINRLGNLTLLSRRLNTAIKNAPFAEKKPRYAESEILLTTSLAEREEWTPDAITERQNELAESAIQIWRWPE